MNQTDRAYEICQKMATEHYENFPVISKFVAPHLRGPIAAIYAFARTADDFADEGVVDGDTRRGHLSDWRRQLNQCVIEKIAENETFLALGDAIEKFEIPVQLLDDLIKAFEMDTHIVRFQKFENVLFYCRHSANPVGRLVLWLHGVRDEQLFLYSDAICTALQLANFWQDSTRDLKRNRIYYPLEDLNELGVNEDELLSLKFSSAVSALVKKQVERTQELFREGKPLCHLVEERLRFHLKLTWLGGFEITRKIERQGYNPFESRPKIQSFDKMKLVWNAIRWS